MTKQRYSYWTETALVFILVIGVFVLINYLGYSKNKRFDLTPEKVYSLSNHTIRMLENLETAAHVTVFYGERDKEAFMDLMKLLNMASDNLSFTFIELDKNPARAQNMGVRSYGGAVIEYQGRKERISYFSEDNFVSTLIRLLDETERIVRFVTGHGEKEFSAIDQQGGYSHVIKALEDENIKVAELLLMETGAVPDETTVLVIAGPQKDFFEKELELIDSYLRNGGRVLFLCDPHPLENIEAYFKSIGIQLSRDFIIDSKSRLMGLDNMTPIISLERRHPITRYISEAVVFPLSRSVIPLHEQTDGIEITPLAWSGSESWAERDTESVYEGQVSFDPPQDLRGPVPVGVIAEFQTDTQPGRLVVFGTSNFAANHYLNVLGNKDLVLNTINWLSEKEDLLSARPRQGTAPVSMLFLTENESRLVLWSAVIVQPALVLLIGILIVLRRRFKR